MLYVLAAFLAMVGLRIETSSPMALCPAIGSVREAAAVRLGQIEGTKMWTARYDLVHRPEAGEADLVRLELHDPEGALRLRRDLPRAGQSCAALTQAMVLVLESFFRRTAETGEKPSRSPEVVVAPAPPSDPPRASLALDILGGWTSGSGPTVATTLRLGIFSERWEVSLGVAWPLDRQEQAVGSGTATQWSTTSRFGLARRWSVVDVLSARIGPEAVFILDRAATSGVPDAMPALRGGFGVGVGGALEARLSRRFAISAIAAADYTPAAWSGRYVIDNYGGPAVFGAEPWRFLTAAGLTVHLER